MKTDIESGIESPEIIPQIYGQTIFDKSAKTKTVFSTNDLEKLDSHMQKVRLDSYTINKSFSKWINNLNIRVKAITLLEEKMRENLHDIGFGDDFLDMIPKLQATTTTKTDKLDFIKI